MYGEKNMYGGKICTVKKYVRWKIFTSQNKPVSPYRILSAKIVEGYVLNQESSSADREARQNH